MLRRLGPPVLVFALVRALLSWVASGVGQHPYIARTWSRWDSAHYLSIAERGYEFFSCARLPGYDPKLMCGNTAWLPGYPLLMRLLAAATGLPLTAAGALLSAACALAVLVLLWNAFLGPKLSAAGLLTLGLAGFFPGQIYDHAVFPIALFALLELIALRLYADRRFVLAGLACAAAAFTYSSGLFLAAALGLHLLFAERKQPYLTQLRTIALVPGGVVAGFIAMLTLQRVQVGAWNAYFLTQAKYAYAFRTPFSAWYDHFLQALQYAAPSQQTIFVMVLCVLMLAYLPWRTELAQLDGALALFLIVYWLTPLMLGGQLSIYRAEATLLPAVSLARRIPVPLLCVLLAVAVFLSLRMSELFFKGVLV
jgi:hypothetical protein